MTISDQWWPRRPSWGSPDPTSWPRILLDPSSRHRRKVNGWGTDGKLCSVQCTLQCVQCVHQTWSMAGSLVPCVHTLANIPRNERSVSADTRCLQWPLRLVSTSAVWHMLQGPLQCTGRGLLNSVYLLCDSHYWGLQRECEQAVLSNSMVLVLLNGVYFGLQTTKEWLKRVSDNSVKIIDVVLLKNDFWLNLA